MGRLNTRSKLGVALAAMAAWLSGPAVSHAQESATGQPFDLSKIMDRIPGGENAAMMALALMAVGTVLAATRGSKSSGLLCAMAAVAALVFSISIGFGDIVVGLVLLLGAVGVALIAMQFK